MKQKSKNFWLIVGGISTIIVFWLITSVVLKGGAWLGELLYPWLSVIFGIAFWVSILILLPLALFRKTRPFSGNSLYIMSFIFGVHLWVTSFLITYNTWGLVAVIIGIFIMGIGVIPIAMLASIVHGEWSTFGQLVLLVVLTIASRIFGNRLAEKTTPQNAEMGTILIK